MPPDAPDPLAASHSLTRAGTPAEVAEKLLGVFDAYQAQFGLVTRRAEARFILRDWRGGQQDAQERLTLYRQFVSWIVQDLRRTTFDEEQDQQFWRDAKLSFIRTARDRPDAELALTFYNSVVRQLLPAARPALGLYCEDRDFRDLPPVSAAQVVRTYAGGSSLELLVREILSDLTFADRFADLAGDARLVAAALAEAQARHPLGRPVDAIEVVPSIFHRNKGAYLVGRIRTANQVRPLVLPLVHGDDGVRVDAVLTTSDDASILFSFTRSYFHVEVDRPRAMIEFLRSIMPRKPIDELYVSLGYHKHGKTELVRALLRHLETTDARFEVAEGDRGLVMSVFALPSMNVVFKIIKDRFGPPKNTTREIVKSKYHLVFVRDRVGRLADAQEFEDLEFERARFAPGLLDELEAEAAGSVVIEPDTVRIRHLYTERLVTPLNLFLRAAPIDAAVDAVLDYGQAIKDLAAADIFTGDMLLKNFGVTRHGRVIFYDYDELCLLTECNFRDLPQPHTEDEEMSAEPWFYVGERDVFPEEFRAFLTLPGRLGDEFMRAHGDLLTVDYWRHMQAMALEGEVVDFFPYRPSRRLRR